MMVKAQADAKVASTSPKPEISTGHHQPHARYWARAACEGSNLTNTGAKMTTAEKIAEHLRQIPKPASAAEIATALKIKPATVKAALCKMTERGQAVHVGKHNATRYTTAQPKPHEPTGHAACTAAAFCNGSMREPLVYSRMHSTRPGAMDYQRIQSLVGSRRVAYRAGVLR